MKTEKSGSLLEMNNQGYSLSAGPLVEGVKRRFFRPAFFAVLVGFAASSLPAALINFDDASDGTVLFQRYSGLTITNPIAAGKNIYARNSAAAPSAPNVASVFSTGLPMFDETYGIVQIRLDTPAKTVSAALRAVGPGEILGTLVSRPYMIVFNTSGSPITTLYYPSSSLPTTGGFALGPTVNLSYTSASANIRWVQLSSEPPAGGNSTYVLVDNFLYDVGPPANDLWSGAISLANGATSSMSTTNATSTGDPVPTCGYNVSNTVWFTFTPASSRAVAVNTCGSDFDTVVQAFLNNAGTLTPVFGACNDDSNVCPDPRQSCIAFSATAGVTYYLMAGGYNGASGNLNITASEVPLAIIQQPAGGTVNAGDSFTFSVAATGPSTFSYQWQLGGANLGGATGSSLTLTDLDPSMTGNYRVVITNIYGAVTSSVATLNVDPALALALDTTGLTWTTGGANGAWYRETMFSHDGVDAARCYGSVSSPPWLETTVTGPGTLSFYWGLAIGYFDTTSDYLSLLVDGVEVAKRNATRDPTSVHYSYQTIYLTSGTHTLRWAYDRNGGDTGGAHLDQVSYTSGATAAFIATQPAPQTVVAGSNTVFTVAASGTPTVTYQWQFAGVNIANATGSSLTLNNVQPIQAGNYSVVVANGYGSPTPSANAALTVTTIPLPVAVDYAGPVWSSSGNAQWFGEMSVTHDSKDAAQSGLLANSQISYLNTTLVGPGTLKFWWKVSSETNFDFLRFYVNGVIQTNISGEVDWRQQTFSLPAGSQPLTWAYTKDGSLSYGSDAAWLDQVTYDGRPILSVYPLPTQQVLLFWPTSVIGCSLQSCTNLAGTISWQGVADVPAVRDDNWAVTNATSSRKFYRLKQ
jgi:hypothetical protein